MNGNSLSVPVFRFNGDSALITEILNDGFDSGEIRYDGVVGGRIRSGIARSPAKATALHIVSSVIEPLLNSTGENPRFNYYFVRRSLGS